MQEGKQQALIKAVNIHKSFNATEVLRGIDLKAHAGEVISLIGSSGSGKSTLLRCINLLEIPEKGDIILKNESLKWKIVKEGRYPESDQQVREFRLKLAMVFQQFNLWQHLTILENCTEVPIHVLGLSKQDATEIAEQYLETVGILNKADNYPAQLSGGQQQRAAIARALSIEPEAILFDEPTSALDPELEQEVIQVILNLAKDNRTMLVVTHDMDMAKDISSKIIFLNEGKIDAEGVGADFFNNPSTPRLSKFLKNIHIKN